MTQDEGRVQAFAEMLRETRAESRRTNDVTYQCWCHVCTEKLAGLLLDRLDQYDRENPPPAIPADPVLPLRPPFQCLQCSIDTPHAHIG